ncbi:MAG: SDR family NAD(P)-dependent oxidoreductase [Treponema sp.]|nr:SDR family NAD(P)-dependent oxidoreductase [Spirochaetia bacterium]MDY4674077.1 SDR family NAD(P)-dependent oxidoreductase [Treponema sp.]
MNQAAFFAPFIRGSLIERTGQHYLVRFLPTAPVADGLTKLTISLDAAAEDESVVAQAISKALEEYSAIPQLVQLVIGQDEYTYAIAQSSSTIEAIAAGKVPDAEAPVVASRATVMKNKVVVVTGGAQGFGAEIVRGLVAGDALVFVADLNLEGATKFTQELNQEYHRTVALPVAVNVADESSVAAMIESIALSAGGLDLCVSNAGVLRASSILQQDMDSFRFVTDINYTAFAIITKHCALLMKRQKAAAPSLLTDIIQINSKSGLEGSNKNGSYAGGKFGSIGLVQSFALELVEYGIKVNAVCPGNFFDGPLWSDPEKGLFVQYLRTGKVPGAKTIADVKKFYEAKVPMNRGCYGEDVIRAVYYLVEQAYETGQALPVTGGQVMLN